MRSHFPFEFCYCTAVTISQFIFYIFLLKKTSHFQELIVQRIPMIPSWDMRNQSKLHFLTDVPGECCNRLPHRYYWGITAYVAGKGVAGVDSLLKCGIKEREWYFSVHGHTQGIHLEPDPLRCRTLHWMFNYLCKIEYDLHERFSQPRRTCIPHRGPVFCQLRPGQPFEGSCGAFPSPMDLDWHSRLNIWA